MCYACGVGGGSFVRCFLGWCLVLFVFAFSLLFARVWFAGGGFPVVFFGFVFALRVLSLLLGSFLVVAVFSAWLRGLSGFPAALVSSLLVVLLGSSVLVFVVPSSGPVVRPLGFCVSAGAVSSPLFFVRRLLRGGFGSVVVVPSAVFCPFSVVLAVSVPCPGGRAGGFSSSGPLVAWLVGLLRGVWVCSLVPGSVVVAGGVCRFSVVVFVAGG